MKITIHRALAELKIIGARIQNSFQELKPLGLQVKGSKVNNLYTSEEFPDVAKGSVQSSLDLINRRNKLKSAIVASNAVTPVNVGGKEMKVADAITLKATVAEKKNFINFLKSHLKNATAKMNLENEKMEANLQQVLNATFGTEREQKADAIKVQSDTFRDTNKVNLVDPLGIEKFIKSLEDDVATFEAEVDAVLSESNATTFVEVD